MSIYYFDTPVDKRITKFGAEKQCIGHLVLLAIDLDQNADIFMQRI